MKKAKVEIIFEKDANLFSSIEFLSYIISVHVPKDSKAVSVITPFGLIKFEIILDTEQDMTNFTLIDGGK